jgi:hypothetical protein
METDMSRAALKQKIKDLVVVISIVMLTGCADMLIDPGGAVVTEQDCSQACPAAAQTQRDKGDEPEAPIRKKKDRKQAIE